jgi:hypothetical protein
MVSFSGIRHLQSSSFSNRLLNWMRFQSTEMTALIVASAAALQLTKKTKSLLARRVERERKAGGVAQHDIC